MPLRDFFSGTGIVSDFGPSATVSMGGLLLRSCLFLFAGDNIQTLYPDLLVNIYVLFFWSTRGVHDAASVGRPSTGTYRCTMEYDAGAPFPGIH